MNQAVLHTQLIHHIRGERHTNWVGISQATGMVMASLHVSSPSALARLRGAAFPEDRWLSDLAGDIVARRRPADLDDPPTLPTKAS